MKEVQLRRFAGPFADVPYDSFIQSPIGLVPKDDGKETRLIFHLSYPQIANSWSVNANTPTELCSVNYPDFNQAICRCLEEIGIGMQGLCYIGCSDFRAAFRNLGVLPEQWKFLLLKAVNPLDGRTYYFVEKCLSFGHAISCALFQQVFDGIAHIVTFKTGRIIVNYLDDFLFAACFELVCNNQIHTFLAVCHEIKFPVALEKTFWGTTKLVFLGFLIDAETQRVAVPKEKITQAINMVTHIINKRNRKITVLQLQRICGFLNFLSRAVIPGRAFTRRLYSLLEGFQTKLRPQHHIKLTKETIMDLDMWLTF